MDRRHGESSLRRSGAGERPSAGERTDPRQVREGRGEFGVENHLFDRQHALQALAVAGIDTGSVLGGETFYVA
jgi:hypothetical protein